jgi:hypothetical protein
MTNRKRGPSMASDRTGAYSTTKLQRMDARFAAALERAIRAGRERDPKLDRGQTQAHRVGPWKA